MAFPSCVHHEEFHATLVDAATATRAHFQTSPPAPHRPTEIALPVFYRSRCWFLCVCLRRHVQFPHDRVTRADLNGQTTRRIAGGDFSDSSGLWLRGDVAMPLYVVIAVTKALRTGTYRRAYGRLLTLWTAFRQMRQFSLHDWSWQRAMCEWFASGRQKASKFCSRTRPSTPTGLLVRFCVFGWRHIGQNTP